MVLVNTVKLEYICSINKHESIGRGISHLFRSINIYLSKELEPYGIGSGQFPFFMRLLHNEGVSQETLANSLKYDRATITRSVNKLEEMGYVVRKRDSCDKRAYCVYLTDKGREMKPLLFSLISQLNDVLLHGFSDEEKAMFISMVEKAARNISSENDMKKASNE
ncbi:MarR family winged helix-turn-helix transcriptional regulator [Methanolobus psychrotolerans]|uniref:MarR family winged helix-turn-helix transcriptional regulator n=1 Tax=Methanolobus psychrotolerans TaxID=1874706 RepID=UPI000B91733B|nr:MarR family transcriptional regulator [Methanolobus psychrotolerans]